jgi:hypothetical protein
MNVVQNTEVSEIESLPPLCLAKYNAQPIGININNVFLVHQLKLPLNKWLQQQTHSHVHVMAALNEAP